MGGGAGDSGKVGGLSFDKPSGATPSGGNKASSANTGGNKASSVDKGEKGGLFSGIKDFFSGGAKGNTGPTAANRPKARPEVLKTGTGKDTRYIDTVTGKSYATPSYGAFSFKGLTSNDPANVARNRYGREAFDAMRAARDARDGPSLSDRGLGSLVPPPETPTTPAPTPAELAALGASNVPMAPIFVGSPIYETPGEIPAINYGTAFMGGPELPPINLMDIFAAYPNFGMR